MVLDIVGVNENIIQVCNGEVWQQSAQRLLYQSAVHTWADRKAEGHAFITVSPKGGGKSCVVPRCRVYTEAVECTSAV